MKIRITLLSMFLALAAGAAAEVKDYQNILAKVGDDIITSWDVDEAVQMIRMSMSPAEAASQAGKDQLEEARKTVLERMIDEKLVVLAAKKGPEGYAEAVEGGQAIKNPFLPAETEVESQMEKIFEETRARFESQEAFEEELGREKINVRELRTRLRERTRIKLTFDKMLGIQRSQFGQLVRVGDDEAGDYYKDNQSEFAIGDQVRLRHILVDDNDKKLAMDILERLGKGETFAKLAERYSKDDFTKDKGGRLGWVEKGQLRWPQLETEAFKAKVGVVAGPVQTGEGWHIIRVDDAKQGFGQSFEKVKPRIKNILFSQKIQGRIEQWLKNLRTEHYVELVE